MSKITDYKTLISSSSDELDKKVNKAIKKGWQPYGYQTSYRVFYQTMIKKQPKIIAINRLKEQDLAKLLGVTPASLSEAAQKDHLCKGYNVAKWARRTSRGRGKEYSVPVKVIKELNVDN